MDISEIKIKLKENGLDAYVIYDFRGSNFLGRKILGFETITTRKFASVLAKDGIFHIVSKMEVSNYTSLPGKILTYTNYKDFEKILKKVISQYKTIAIDISDNNSLPIVDLTPYGFIQLIKKVYPKVKLVSSENFTQGLAATWGKKGYKTHKEAARILTEIFGKTFDYIYKNIKRRKVTDYEAMQFAINLQKKSGLHSDGENICIVACGPDSANPHYWPHAEKPHAISKNSPLLMDMWARTKEEGSIYADFTMYAWVGPKKPEPKIMDAWQLWKKARDTGILFVKENIQKGVRGFEVDQKIMEVFEKEGYSKYMLHRSGHSLGQKEHGNGANLDDFETHDTRLLIPDTGMTIEPGIYTERYGVRGEIDMFIHENKRVEVTTPLQDEIIIL